MLQKTRTDAMLEKIRSQSIASVRDPLKDAKLWNIPIWTVNKVSEWRNVTIAPDFNVTFFCFNRLGIFLVGKNICKYRCRCEHGS